MTTSSPARGSTRYLATPADAARVLAALRECPGLTEGAIAAYLGMRRNVVHSAVLRLEREWQAHGVLLCEDGAGGLSVMEVKLSDGNHRP